MRKIITGLCFVGASFALLAHAQTPPPIQQQAAIDYDAFSLLTQEVRDYRESRLVSQAEFFEMADAAGTIILDTRSKEAYDYGHVKGAVHLNFSDFTDAKLAKVIGSADRRILIYCNNNFSNNARPFLTKRVELALNVPTFINLYGYGYKNIYELKDSVDMNDPDMRIVATIP